VLFAMLPHPELPFAASSQLEFVNRPVCPEPAMVQFASVCIETVFASLVCTPSMISKLG
jgi:hypothetical protein